MEVQNLFFWASQNVAKHPFYSILQYILSFHPVKERQTGYLKPSRRDDKWLQAQAVHLLEGCDRVWNI